MVGLWADGWFYIASAGLLVSAVLFFFLLGQYRAASEAADQTEPASALETQVSPIRAVYAPVETPIRPIPSAPSERIEIKSTSALPASVPAGSGEKRRDTATEGVSPAVVYLQNIKNQLKELHGEIGELAKRVELITGRDEALVEHLIELAQAVAELKGQSPAAHSPVHNSIEELGTRAAEPVLAAAPAPEPEPAAAPEPEIRLEPQPEPQPEPKLEPQSEPKPEPQPAAQAPVLAVELPAPAVSSPPPVEPKIVERPARGPVWPV